MAWCVRSCHHRSAELMGIRDRGAPGSSGKVQNGSNWAVTRCPFPQRPRGAGAMRSGTESKAGKPRPRPQTMLALGTCGRRIENLHWTEEGQVCPGEGRRKRDLCVCWADSWFPKLMGMDG